MTNIYLVGMPGCGKTTIGSLVSDKLGLSLVDLDEYIVEKTGRSIPEIFEDGESSFRKIETDALEDIAADENQLVATGGGIVTVKDNIDIMKRSGKVIFIDASVDFIMSNSSLDGRPLLKDKTKIHTLYKERINLYRKSADFTVLNDGILSDVCKRVEEVIRIKCK